MHFDWVQTLKARRVQRTAGVAAREIMPCPILNLNLIRVTTWLLCLQDQSRVCFNGDCQCVDPTPTPPPAMDCSDQPQIDGIMVRPAFSETVPTTMVCRDCCYFYGCTSSSPLLHECASQFPPQAVLAHLGGVLPR